MNEAMMARLKMAGWINGKLHITTQSMKQEDLRLWQSLLEADPDQAKALAAYGYKQRQFALYGQDCFSDEELAEFVREFLFKLDLVAEGNEGVKLPLFECSVPNLRH